MGILPLPLPPVLGQCVLAALRFGTDLEPAPFCSLTHCLPVQANSHFFLSPETRRAAPTPTLALEGRVQSLHGTPSLTQGSWSPRNGAKLGAYARPGDVGDLGGRTPSSSDTLASAGDFFCTM